MQAYDGITARISITQSRSYSSYRARADLSACRSREFLAQGCLSVRRLSRQTELLEEDLIAFSVARRYDDADDRGLQDAVGVSVGFR